MPHRDRTREVYGDLTVTGLSHKRKHSHGYATWWHCLCICGNTSVVPATKLTSGRIKSCGCRKQRTKLGKDKERGLLKFAKARAKRTGREFNLTLEDIEIPEVCPVLGITLYITGDKVNPNSPTLDRIDSSKGYVKGNVKVISWRANALKKDGSVEEFERILAYMKSHPSRG